MIRSGGLRVLLVGALLSVPATAGAASSQTFVSERYEFRLTTLASGLAYPWALAFLPNGDMLISERAGRLRMLRDGKLDPSPIPGGPDVVLGGQGGLLDIALHPRFAETHLVYLSYSGAGAGGSGTEVARGRLVEDRLVDLKTILVVQPKSPGVRHYGSRLLFGRDGRLYVTTGERGDRNRAQDLGDLAGKVLRISDDGAIPSDNPFIGRPDARPEIFSYGNRNPQGLAMHPETGQIWEVEHGPKGGDELNILSAGANYGWPVITYGRSYGGQPIGEGTAKAGMEQPIKYWTPSISPSGMVFYTGDDFPDWRGNLFVGALSGRALVRLELDGKTVLHEERLLKGLRKRIRDVRQGPDGRLYLLTDEPNGALLRVDPIQ